MAEWLVERGIGEDRAIRVEHGAITAARLQWKGELCAGEVAEARLVRRAVGAARGLAEFPSGERVMVDRLPRDAAEGASLRLEVTRSAMLERGRGKIAQARPSTMPPAKAPSLSEQLAAAGEQVHTVQHFPAECGWGELWQEAAQGQVAFAGGTLLFYPTPALTLVDIDGVDEPRALALSAVAPIAVALARFDIGGNIGIDFPTLGTKADRHQVDQALATALAALPHERTAMNGFGFVQIVTRLDRPSLLTRIAFDYPGAAARALLRQAETLGGPGLTELRCSPRLAAALTPEWLAELERRTARPNRVIAEPGLAPNAWHAQVVAHD